MAGNKHHILQCHLIATFILILIRDEMFVSLME